MQICISKIPFYCEFCLQTHTLLDKQDATFLEFEPFPRSWQMRLVFFIDNFRKIGGGTYAQFVFAKTLALRGHKVVIFAGDKNFYSEELKVENLTVYYRQSIPVAIKGIGIGELNNWLAAVHRELVIAPFLKKFKPDWIIGYLRVSAIKAEILGARLNLKVANFVYETPDWMEQQLGEKLPPKLMRSWTRTKIAYEKSHVLIPNSKLSGSNMGKWIAEAKVSEPVYPGIDESVINTSHNSERDIDIIYIGRLNRLKNVDDLLMACGPEHKLAIIGAGDELSRLEEISSSRDLQVEFLGSVSDDHKWQYLRRSKLLVTPTSFEGFGMPPLEALASGCKVICSDIPIFREVYGDEVTYFEVNNVGQLKQKIKELLEDTNHQSSELPYRYTWDQAANTIETILSSY